MKKFLAILMAAVMLLAVVSVGVAEEPTYAKSSEYDASGDAPFTPLLHLRLRHWRLPHHCNVRLPGGR